MVAASTCGAWFVSWPSTLVQVRIVADMPGPAGRAALADAALRLGGGPHSSATLDPPGDALVIAVENADAAVANRRARSQANAVLNLPYSAPPGPTPRDPAPSPIRQDTRAAPLAEQSYALTTIRALDARIATASASLTGIVRDIAAGLRITAERKGGRETLDKGAAALADLQLQRIQLQSRYQDDFPAVLAVDGQMRTLRAFLQDEARRIDTNRAPVDPASPVLAGERDRLRAELAQLNDQRAALASDLAAAVGALAVTPPIDDPPPPPPPAPAAAPSPMLVEAATTIAYGPDTRWIAVPATAVAGLLLVLGAWFKPRRFRNAQQGMLLESLHRTRPPRGAAAAVANPGDWQPLGYTFHQVRITTTVLGRAPTPVRPATSRTEQTHRDGFDPFARERWTPRG